MSHSYKFIDHTADIAFEVSADSYEELFTASAEAWKEAVLENPQINGKEERKIIIKEDSLEELLVSFLNELNFLFLSKKWIFNSIKNISVKNNGVWKLNSVLLGEPLLKEHIIKSEIKAVTFHQMDIKKINNNFTTRIVFDI